MPNNSSTRTRRFDATTLAVFVAAYLVIIALMTLAGFPLLGFLFFGGLLTSVAVMQMLFTKSWHPWVASAVMGALSTTTTMHFVMHEVTGDGLFGPADPFDTVMLFVLGISKGAILGCLMGLIVTGLFRLADRLRRPSSREDSPSAGPNR